MITSDQLRELQRFAELGRLSASLLHEISQPLSAALLHLEVSDQRSAAVRGARRNIRILRRYVEAARQQVRHQGRPTSFALQPQLDQVKQIVLPLARRASVRAELQTPPRCRLRGDPVKFQQILTNLLVNAIEACDNGHGGKVRLTFRRQDDQLVVTVTDWGKGIAPDHLPRLFDTFYSTKDRPGGRGLGLGLAIVKHYMSADFGGSVTVSSDCHGTSFVARFPIPPLSA